MKVWIHALALTLAVNAPAGAVSLQSLFDGGTISAGAWEFYDFTLSENNADGEATAVNAELVEVTDTVLPGNAVRLNFDMGGQTRIGSGAASNQFYEFDYRIRDPDGGEFEPIPQVALTSSFSSNGTSGGVQDATVKVFDRNVTDLAVLETLLIDGGIETAQAEEPFTGTFIPIRVRTELVMAIVNNPAGTVHEIESFEVQFSSIPIPSALWLFGSALLAAGFIGRRKT